ncbi:hypothetical protein COO60DRAFT_580304 [Scenedesmus sp. NREL 46B-D3]|nr:hypothetical protein COO60DRAFT_580304 [Scenedesmus sp. NREL 46B-D3]
MQAVDNSCAGLHTVHWLANLAPLTLQLVAATVGSWLIRLIVGPRCRAVPSLQEATPAALLAANDMLLKLEGAGSAQALQLPHGTGLSAALAAAAGGDSSAAGTSAAAAAAAMACKLVVAGGSAALPQVHGLLLEHLDLVPSRGGLEAAGLRFLQLQMHANNGQYEAALESCFNGPADNASSHVQSPSAVRLSGQVEVADAVVRLVADNAATPSISGLVSSAPYQALLGLAVPGACSEGGAGDGLLAGLSSAMQLHLLRCGWGGGQRQQRGWRWHECPWARLTGVHRAPAQRH